MGAAIAGSAFAQGWALGLSLIVAIGAQNAFVLRQGLRREHVGSIALFCAAADALLITAGVLGMAQLLGRSPWLAQTLGWLGFAFLVGYGLQALRRAGTKQGLRAEGSGPSLSHTGALAQAAAFTLLNPHVYLDTVLLVGSIGARQAPASQIWFIAGASSASLFWFTALAYGARWLAPWFARPEAWRRLDVLIGLTMLVLAALLLRQLQAGF